MAIATPQVCFLIRSAANCWFIDNFPSTAHATQLERVSPILNRGIRLDWRLCGGVKLRSSCRISVHDHRLISCGARNPNLMPYADIKCLTCIDELSERLASTNELLVGHKGFQVPRRTGRIARSLAPNRPVGGGALRN